MCNLFEKETRYKSYTFCLFFFFLNEQFVLSNPSSRNIPPVTSEVLCQNKTRLSTWFGFRRLQWADELALKLFWFAFLESLHFLFVSRIWTKLRAWNLIFGCENQLVFCFFWLTGCVSFRHASFILFFTSFSCCHMI